MRPTRAAFLLSLPDTVGFVLSAREFLIVILATVSPAVVAVFNDFPVFTRLLHSDHFDADRHRPMTFLAADVFAEIDLVSNPFAFERYLFDQLAHCASFR